MKKINTERKGAQLNAKKNSIDLSRRRFAKAGLIASPILASLPGKSALAGNCTSISGMLSGNLSAPNNGGNTCDGDIEHAFGLSPGYWRTVCTNAHQFPVGYQFRDFLDVITYGASTMACPGTLTEYTLLEALWLRQDHCDAVQWEINLTRQSIAAFFSAITSDQYFVGPEQVIEIYNSVIVSGGTGIYNEPVTGMTLDYNDVIYMYEQSYMADMGNVTITDNDTFIECEGYRYDNSKGHLYIKDFSSNDYYRLDALGNKYRMLRRGTIQRWDGLNWNSVP